MMSHQRQPLVALQSLDELWFQVSGTLCNLTCNHCFISCSPHNHSFGYLSEQQIRQQVMQGLELGVKEIYFTGGEPFLHPAMTEIIEWVLPRAPVSLLTNATILKPEWLTRLQRAAANSRYSLEFRVSVDGFTAEINDPIRGAGTFARAVRGIQTLVEYGFLPIITAARTWPELEDSVHIQGFTQLLLGLGYSRPRIKLLPALKLGAEIARNCGYAEHEKVTAEMMESFDSDKLLCSKARIVTSRGVHVCPILIDLPESRLSADLSGSLNAFPIIYGACSTCYQYGSICANPSSAPLERLL